MAEDKNTHRWVLPEGASTYVYLAPGEELPEEPKAKAEPKAAAEKRDA